ncbi:putative metal-dependent phosphohydrolase, HD region [Pseudoalteromonas tunicata D2]|uniref:Putative metal-dependent phosphohydrolase, HD region n=2 Tax=Pseudoalteromonas tunicata TaxID=314281 RepID=A4C961_9GAMM|nr:putative metal-dependent phosphohydrolase, HD region [Pseudoalteromonas tunicata D2]
MPFMLKVITIAELKPGMYVTRILKQKSNIKIKTGIVRSQSLIDTLALHGIKKLEIDLKQSETAQAQQQVKPIVTPLIAPEPVEKTDPQPEPTPKQKKPAVIASDETSLEEEFQQASAAYDAGLRKITTLQCDLMMGQSVNIAVLDEVGQTILESVFRNESAMAVLTRLRDKNTYAFRHSINTAILVTMFGKFLGYNKNRIIELTMGALFHDLGQSKVPQGILSKADKLTELERKAVQKHVAHSFSLAKQYPKITPLMIDVIINHHERLDGSGYPRGLKGDKLSTAAKIIAIVDVYDALTADRHFKSGIEPIAALRYLMSKPELFDSVLVQKFIRCVGVHPVGSIVKLTGEKLALVLEGNRAAPLKPKIQIFYNAKHQHYITRKKLCLVEHGQTIKIISGVQPQDHQINLSRLLKEQLSV